MKKVINNIHKNYPKSPNTTWWRLPEEVKDIEDRTTSLEGRDLSNFKNESANKFIRSLDLAELGQQIKFDFKKGSVGEIVSFVKPDDANFEVVKDIIIPGELEITRGNVRGIYNIALESSYDDEDYDSPLNTYWCSHYTDSTANILSPLTSIPDRNYDNWRNAVDSNPPGSVGMTMIMKWDNGEDTPRYWVVEFTEWGIGSDKNNFGYNRYELFLSSTFEQPSTDNTDTLQLVDFISNGVHLTRKYTGGGLYNKVSESSYQENFSPKNTRWNSEYTDSRLGYSGFTDLTNIESRIYSDWENAIDNSPGNNATTTDLVMHDLTTDLYYKIDFSNWAQGCNDSSGPGGVTNWNITYSGSGYPNGGYYGIDTVGGSGIGLNMTILVIDGKVDSVNINNRGQNYQVGDIITLAYPGEVTDPATIEITNICSMGGFAYTRTVIPQSNGIKFADGTVLDTASVSSSAASYDMVYTKGTLDVNVESDFIQLADTIVVPPSNGITAYTLNTSGTLVVGDCFEVFGIGGSGSGARATINITGPSNYNFTITDPGTNYEIGDIVDFTCGTATISTDVTEIDDASTTTYNKYKLKGIVNFPNVNSLSSVYLIGVISGSDKLVMTGDQTTMKATVSPYNELYSKFGVNSYIRDSNSGSIATTTFGTIVLDNTLASPDDYFISIIASSSITKWESVAYLDIEFIAPAANNLTFSN